MLGKIYIKCSNLSEINYPVSLKQYGDGFTSSGEFNECPKLTKIVIPEGVESIPNYMFCDMKSLEEIILPETLKGIGPGAFRGCSGLTDAYYPGNEDDWNQQVDEGEDNDDLLRVLLFSSSSNEEIEVTVSVSAEGKGTVSGSGTFEEGSSVTVTATPEENQSFLGWYKNDQKVSEDQEYTFTIKEDIVLIGKFTSNEIVIQPEQYTVSVSSEGKGTVSGSGTFEEGSSVTASATPEANQSFLGWYKGNELVSEATEYTFTIEIDTILVGKFTSNESGETTTNPFTDVSAESYYYKPVLWAVENKITSGTSDTTFSPEDSCTRAQMVTFMWRAKGCPEPASTSNPFTDVKEDAYYYKAVLWAAEQKITTGTSDTTFSPEATVNRAQSVTFLWRMEGSEVVSADNPFTDVSTGAYYYNAVLWAVKNGVTTGKSKTSFAPDDPCIRVQIVTFLYRNLAE